MHSKILLLFVSV